jgi:hypothetical protein
MLLDGVQGATQGGSAPPEAAHFKHIAAQLALAALAKICPAAR